MKDNIPIQELIDTYLMNKMSDDERTNFELEMLQDSELQKKVEIQRLIMEGFKRQGIINDIKSEIEKEKKNKIYRIIIFAASSAAIFLLVFLTNIYRENNRMDRLFSQNFEMPAEDHFKSPGDNPVQKEFLDAVSLLEKNDPKAAKTALLKLYDYPDNYLYYEEVRWYLALTELKLHNQPEARKYLHELISIESDTFEYGQKAKQVLEKL